MPEDDHYAVLQVDRRACPEVVQAAFEALRELLLREDPDDAPRRLVALNAAHAVLSDPARRAEYDKSL